MRLLTLKLIFPFSETKLKLNLVFLEFKAEALFQDLFSLELKVHFGNWQVKLKVHSVYLDFEANALFKDFQK